MRNKYIEKAIGEHYDAVRRFDSALSSHWARPSRSTSEGFDRAILRLRETRAILELVEILHGR